MTTLVEGIAANGGVRLAYELRGGGGPVVLVHGLGYARWGWEPVADTLAESFLVALFDNRGIGDSDVPPGPYAVGDLARDAVAVLDAAGIERAHVVGTSLGGMAALELALSFPERVGRLVLACTTPGGAGAYAMPAATVELIARAPTLPPPEALRLFVENALAPATVDGRPDVVERIYEHRLASPPDPHGWQAQAAAGAGFDRLADVGEIRAPTLVLTGTDDVVVDPRNSELLADRIPGARLERFPGTGHLFFWEQPERFVALVREFLTASPREPGGGGRR